jgi:hypothetical protein
VRAARGVDGGMVNGTVMLMADSEAAEAGAWPSFPASTAAHVGRACTSEVILSMSRGSSVAKLSTPLAQPSLSTTVK